MLLGVFRPPLYTRSTRRRARARLGRLFGRIAAFWRASETPTTGLSVASSVRMVLTRLIALFDLRRLSIPRNGKFVLSGLNRSKPEIIFPGKSAWFPGSIEKKLKI